MADAIPISATSGSNAHAVASELSWLGQVIDACLANFFSEQRVAWSVPQAPVPDQRSALGNLVRDASLTAEDRVILALALATHVQPSVLDPLFVRNTALDRTFCVFGGTTGREGAFVATGETALFLLAGDDPAARIAAMDRLSPDAPLRQDVGLSLLRLEQGSNLGAFSGVLSLSSDRVLELCSGTAPPPDHDPSFPARRLRTGLDWDDLVLPDETRHEIEHIFGWLTNEDRIMNDWGLARSLMPGFRVLFHGPPGTGKSLTAALLGKRSGMDVYRVDLSMMVSKYIGETEKNLAGVFDMARRKNWILFFDEADALFGNRTTTTSSNDRYANQEVAYLLQRIEETPGMIILATNLKGNIDDAFLRRFQSSVAFIRPDARARSQLWRVALGPDVPLAADVDIDQLAAEFELTGGSISNVVRRAAVVALRRGNDKIAAGDLRSSIGSEMRKEGRTG